MQASQYMLLVNKNNPRNQAGAALMVSLILLVVMTLIGVLSMENARFENIMGQNQQSQTSAMANAELTLLAAETELKSIVDDNLTHNFLTTGDHYYYPIGTLDPDAASESWSFSHSDSPTGKYIIEYWGKTTVTGESSEIGSVSAGTYLHVFETSAQSTNGKGAKRAVQSVFVSDKAP